MPTQHQTPPHRQWTAVRALLLAAGLAQAACGNDEATPESQPPSTPALPDVQGPIQEPGNPFIDPLEQGFTLRVADRGYVFQEYFVSGTAAGQPYKVRLFMARPGDSAAVSFSGHAIVEPKHPSSIPFVWSFTREYLMAGGHAAVEISTFPSTVELLRTNNPERYGELQATDEQTSDIFAQVGTLLKSPKTPLSGVRQLYMTGHSRSAGPTWHFMNTHHASLRLADGGPIFDGFFPETTRTASRFGPFPDVDVPTLLINSELEVEEVLVKDKIDYRKPDSDEPGRQFRLYEVAGMPHNPAWRNPLFAGSTVAQSCNQPLNAFPYEPTISMALDHLIRWVQDGIEPPHSEPISVIGYPGNPTAIERDEHGNARGGVRSTTLDVPVATHQALNEGMGAPGIGDCLVFGSQIDFGNDKLVLLYGDRMGYVSRVEQRLDQLIQQGWFLEQFAGSIREQAANFDGFQ